MKNFITKQISKNLTVHQILDGVAFSVIYSFAKGEEYQNLIIISLLFWTIEINW